MKKTPFRQFTLNECKTIITALKQLKSKELMEKQRINWLIQKINYFGNTTWKEVWNKKKSF